MADQPEGLMVTLPWPLMSAIAEASVMSLFVGLPLGSITPTENVAPPRQEYQAPAVGGETA